MSNLGTVGNFGVVHKDKAFNFSAVGATMINWAFTVDSATTYLTVPTTMTGGQSIRYLRVKLASMSWKPSACWRQRLRPAQPPGRENCPRQ